MRIALFIVAFTLSPALAHADDNLDLDPLTLHINGGVEVLGGNHGSSAGFRAHGGVAMAFGAGSIRPFIGLGGTLGSGQLAVADRRALDGTVSVGMLTYGPEAQVGLRFANGGWIDTRVFAGLAQLHTKLDNRLMLDPIKGVTSADGMRVSIGANWADRLGSAVSDNLGGRGHELDWLLLIVPQQLEIAWERSAGSDRVGVAIAYGI